MGIQSTVVYECDACGKAAQMIGNRVPSGWVTITVAPVAAPGPQPMWGGVTTMTTNRMSYRLICDTCVRTHKSIFESEPA